MTAEVTVLTISGTNADRYLRYLEDKIAESEDKVKNLTEANTRLGKQITDLRAKSKEPKPSQGILRGAVAKATPMPDLEPNEVRQ